jgi:hypothetical protein
MLALENNFIVESVMLPPLLGRDVSLVGIASKTATVDLQVVPLVLVTGFVSLAILLWKDQIRSDIFVDNIQLPIVVSFRYLLRVLEYSQLVIVFVKTVLLATVD